MYTKTNKKQHTMAIVSDKKKQVKVKVKKKKKSLEMSFI